MTELELSDGERSHPIWARIKAHLVNQLARLRVRNDAPADERDTAALRGRIAATKAFIALGDDKPIL